MQDENKSYATVPNVSATISPLPLLINNSSRIKTLGDEPYFSVEEKGIFYHKDGNKSWICSKLEIKAYVRDKYSEQWGRLLEFTDPDGQIHCWAMPMEMLKGSGDELRGELMNQGLLIAPGIKWRHHLIEYINTTTPDERALCVNRTGWYGDVFVLPDRTIGQTEELVIYQAERQPRQYRTAGTLIDWQTHIAKHCVGNSRFVVAVSSAFAAMLLHHAGAESGGLHFVGESTCSSLSSTRYGHWTRCFKLSELQANVKEHVEESKKTKSYSFSYQGITHPVRLSTWRFLKAVQLLKEFELKPENESLDPWSLKNIGSIERALLWVGNRVDNNVQVSLFSEKNNRLPSPKLHVYAAKAKLNVEDLAYTTLKPERLVLHAIIALLTVRTMIKDSTQLEKDVSNLYKKFFQINPEMEKTWENEFSTLGLSLNQLVNNHINDSEKELKNLTDEQRKDISEIKSLVTTLDKAELDERSQAIYHLYESNLQIATTIHLYKKYHAIIQQNILTKVSDMITVEIAEQKFQELERYPLANRQCYAVTGPVASGKSVSEKLARKQLAGKNAAFISSDEWNKLLCANLNLTGFVGYGGKLTLAEAWYIKCIIWNDIQKMEQAGRAPNWIQEACDPSSIKPPALAKMEIFINTSSHVQAANRVKVRGEKSGRYVSASAATGSYRWPWLNFISTLEKNKNMPLLTIKLMDTDVMHYSLQRNEQKLSEEERETRTNIATFNHGVLTIHNMQRFITLIQRSFKITAWPKNLTDIWQKDTSTLPKKLLKEIKEIDKLFKFQLIVQYHGKNLSPNLLYEECAKRYRVERSLEHAAERFHERKKLTKK